MLELFVRWGQDKEINQRGLSQLEYGRADGRTTGRQNGGGRRSSPPNSGCARVAAWSIREISADGSLLGPAEQGAKGCR